MVPAHTVVSGDIHCLLPNVPVGGRLSLFLTEWERASGNPWVLSTLMEGHLPRWKHGPPSFTGIRCTPVPSSQEKAEVLRAEVVALLDKAAIERVPLGQESQGFYSTYFLVTKK